MIKRARVAVVGVGNTVSALVQGIALYRETGSLVGVRNPIIGGLGVTDVDFVAAFALSDAKVGKDLTEVILLPPNNFPRLDCQLPLAEVTVQRGLLTANEIDRVTQALLASSAEVLLYSAPSGRPAIARAYAEAALHAGVAFINTTSDPIARDSSLLDRFAAARLPLVGDDLASQFGSSTVLRTLLQLLQERGLTLVSSYQISLGGTEDFRNLVENSNTKSQSKLNALSSDESIVDKVQLAPLGYLSHLKSQKVGLFNIEALAWGETTVSVDVKLKVSDPSGGAGVIIDLIRLAATALRDGRGGYLDDASPLLKSPPGTAV